MDKTIFLLYNIFFSVILIFGYAPPHCVPRSTAKKNKNKKGRKEIIDVKIYYVAMTVYYGVQ